MYPESQNYTPINIQELAARFEDVTVGNSMAVQTLTPQQSQETAQKKPMSNRFFIIVVAGGLSLLLFLFIIIIAAPKNQSNSDVVPTPTIEVTPTPIISPTPTPKKENTDVMWKTYKISGTAEFKYPSNWNLLARLPPDYIDATGANRKIFVRDCTGPVIQNPASPSASLIVINTEHLNQFAPDQPCVAPGNFNDFYIRHATTFNPPQDIKVVKWKPNDYFEGGIIKRSEWNGDLFEQYSVRNEKAQLNVTFTLITKDGKDIQAEPIFDQLLATIKLLTPVDTSIKKKKVTLQHASVMIPDNWWSETLSDSQGKDLVLVNSYEIKDNNTQPAFILKYANNAAPDDVINSEKTALGLNDVTVTDVNSNNIAGKFIEGTSSLGQFKGKTLRLAVYQINGDVFYIENYDPVNPAYDYLKDITDGLSSN